MMIGGSLNYELPRFDGKENFSLWQLQVKDLLSKQGMENALLNQKPRSVTKDDWDEMQDHALSTIRLCLSDDITKHVVDLITTPRQLWNKLETLYLSKSLSTKLSTEMYLGQRLYGLKICDASNLMEHIDTFNQKVGDLASVDVKIEDKNKDMILLCSLPPLLTALSCNKERSSGNEDGNGERWLEVISWEPRAFLYHNFLTNEECEHLINLAKPSMVKSLVRDTITGGGKGSSARTSSGTFFRRGHDKIVEEIEKRISEFTFIPVENGEGLQVIRYEVGQKFDPHFDGYERIATVLMYLSDVEQGGETVFPAAKGKTSKKGLSVSPKKRDALLFWNMKPDGTRDLSSKHAGRPVIRGNKWASTKWLHVHEYKPTTAILRH